MKEKVKVCKKEAAESLNSDTGSEQKKPEVILISSSDVNSAALTVVIRSILAQSSNQNFIDSLKENPEEYDLYKVRNCLAAKRDRANPSITHPRRLKNYCLRLQKTKTDKAAQVKELEEAIEMIDEYVFNSEEFNNKICCDLGLSSEEYGETIKELRKSIASLISQSEDQIFIGRLRERTAKFSHTELYRALLYKLRHPRKRWHSSSKYEHNRTIKNKSISHAISLINKLPEVPDVLSDGWLQNSLILQQRNERNSARKAIIRQNAGAL